MRVLITTILSLATLALAPAAQAGESSQAGESYHPCAGTYTDPAGGLDYTRIRASRVPCRIARSVTRRYASDIAPSGHPRTLTVFDSNDRRWRCVRYQRGQGDGRRYVLVVCKAVNGRRVRFRGYS